jgi:hypothetical protein
MKGKIHLGSCRSRMYTYRTEFIYILDLYAKFVPMYKKKVDQTPISTKFK